MLNTLKLFSRGHLKRSKLTHNSGFTLIELLVGLVLAALVITPLMSFMINILDTNRKEEAKANSEQEIQLALEYIAQDLQQAVYIYDAKGLDNLSSTNPANSGIKDQIPPGKPAGNSCVNEPPNNICLPVLVFWKREFREDVFPRENSTESEENRADDTFVYSLVGYYLVKGNNADKNWSSAARIGRFQITDGVRNITNLTNPDTPNYTITYDENPSPGFQLFNLRVPGSTTLEEKMNSWHKKQDENYNDTVDTLVEFIADSNENRLSCPAAQQVPSTLAGGFYACVDSSNNSARIYIRGNALARIRDVANCDRESIYCPTASVQIQGRGLLNAD